MRPTLWTERLAGRPFARADWRFLLALYQDPTVAPWLLGPHAAASVDLAQEKAERIAASWDDAGFGPYLWSIGPRAIGYAGLRPARIGAEEEVIEALWGFAPSHWGKGYAEEAARAALEADGPRAIEERSVAAWTLPDNRRSRALMERLGFVHDGEIVHAGLEHVLYRWRPQK